MILRGILARSFNNILCLRGFAALGDLADLSFPDDYQRDEIKPHSTDIAEFLDSGKYTFFPEVILGGSLRGLGFSDEDITDLYQAVDQGNAFKLKNIGDISISTYVKKFKKEEIFDPNVTGSFYKLGKRMFTRIDGNHRLQAIKHSSERVKKYQAPFCLVLFRDDDEQQRFGRVFFHMINFRSVPISEELNLKLILEQEDYSDEMLQASPFGMEFVVARMCLRDKAFQKTNGVSLSHTTLLKLIRYLIQIDGKSDELVETLNSLDILEYDRKRAKQLYDRFKELVGHFGNILKDNAELHMMCMMNENIFATLLVVGFRDMSECPEFMVWLQNCRREDKLGLLDVSFDKIIVSFDAEQRKRKHTIFVSMQFGSCGTEQNYETIQSVVKELNDDYNLNPPLEIVRVDKLVTGETFEINEKVINDVSQCGYLIADLTYCNSNVYHEIGMLMGRTLALTGKHEYNMTLILDKQVSHENRIVKFNLQSLQYLAFSKQEELAEGIKKRIKKFYRLK